MPQVTDSMAASACGFTFAHYREILERALSLGYRFATHAEHAGIDSPRALLMRHDVDLSLDNCLTFAKIEHALGIRSTYFVRVHARLYNPFEYHSYVKLKAIESMGHELGLHYEPGFAVVSGEDESAMVHREKAVLEAILGHPIVGAAAHLPGKNGRTVTEANAHDFGLRYEAYAARFTRDFKYLSDSNGRWREGCVCAHLGQHDRLCVLTHGFWWYDQSPVENY